MHLPPWIIVEDGLRDDDYEGFVSTASTEGGRSVPKRVAYLVGASFFVRCACFEALQRGLYMPSRGDQVMLHGVFESALLCGGGGFASNWV